MKSHADTAALGLSMTLDELLALPVSVDLVTAGRAWQLGRTKAHELARAGEFPCPVLRIGKTYRVTRADLLRSLGISPTSSEGAPDQERPANTTTATSRGIDVNADRTRSPRA